MKLAIVGSRGLTVANIGEYLSDDVTEIVSGGARGIDRLAAEYAGQRQICLTEFLPDYAKYGRGAPLMRNAQIAEYAEAVLAFWDGKSRGTLHTISLFARLGKKVTVIRIDEYGHIYADDDFLTSAQY